MATCPLCKESMLTERPHVHGGVGPGGRLMAPSVADREPELVIVRKDEWERLRAAVVWFWQDMREVDRHYLRGDQPALVALCEQLEHADATEEDARG